MCVRVHGRTGTGTGTGGGGDPSLKPHVSSPVLSSGSAESSLQKAEKVLKKVLEWGCDEVPNRDELLGNLHSCIGNAQLELGQTAAALQSHRRDLDIAREQ